jgi:hypothetical protein
VPPSHRRYRTDPASGASSPMLTTVSLMAHRQHQQDRARSRYRENLRQAMIVATHADDSLLREIVIAVDRGDWTYDQGNELVLKVRADQRQRQQADAA